MFFRTAWDLIRQAWNGFSADNAFRLSAALAYYTALSLSPLLLMVISIAGLVFGEAAARGQVEHQIQDLVGQQGAEAVQTMLAHSSSIGGNVVAIVVGVVVLVVGATGVFAQLQDALNTVWNVDPKKTSAGGLWGMLKSRLLSFALVCGLAFLLLVSLVLNALVSGLSAELHRWIPGAATLVEVLNILLSALLTLVLFAMIFKVLPDVELDWSDVWIGAGITTVLFTLGKYGIGIYLGQASVGSAYGAAGSFVVLLTWLYYSSAIMLFGAEFTQVYATQHGSRVGKPDGTASQPAPAPSRDGHAATPVGAGSH